LNSSHDKNKLDSKYKSNNDSKNNYIETFVGIATINSTRGGYTPDIHNIPNPTVFVNPWLMSSLQMENNLY
jgi:hypothetical protein